MKKILYQPEIQSLNDKLTVRRQMQLLGGRYCLTSMIRFGCPLAFTMVVMHTADCELMRNYHRASQCELFFPLLPMFVSALEQVGDSNLCVFTSLISESLHSNEF